MRNWLIKFLGGYTQSQLDDFKDKCAEFAQENLKGKNGEISPNVGHYCPWDAQDDLLILRGNIMITGGLVKSLYVAPWCRNVFISDIKMRGSNNDI